jgi:hypothetical protein
MEEIGKSIKGIFRDRLIGPDGNLLYDSGWARNTIVDSCRALLAGLMKNELVGGMQYLAVGRGKETWDTDGVPAPGSEEIELISRYSPTIPDPNSGSDWKLVYLDENDDVTHERTNRLQITATLEPGYPAPEPPLSTYPLREFGLFGGADGTYMINCVRHPVIHKHTSATLIRVIRLYF